MISLLSRARRFAWLLLAVALLAFATFFAFAAAGAKSSAARSARLQHEGIRVVGTVSGVHNTVSTQRTDTQTRRYRSDVTVTLPAPVRGHPTTTLHFSNLTRLVVGQAVTVLVDPRDPGYAEQPGHGTSSTQWKVLTIAAVGTGGLALLVGGFAGRRWRRGRARPDEPVLVA